jgi:glutathione S-transferase
MKVLPRPRAADPQTGFVFQLILAENDPARLEHGRERGHLVPVTHARMFPLLYGHHESGHSFKVALALSLAGIQFHFRWVDLSIPPEQRPAEVRAVSKFNEVPVLVDDSLPLVQSNAILLHLARKHRCLGGETEDRHALSREWLFWEANRIGFSLANLRHLVYFEGCSAGPVVDWLRSRLMEDLGRLSAKLTAESFLLGDTVSVADVSCCAYLVFAHQAQLDLAPWPPVSSSEPERLSAGRATRRRGRRRRRRGDQ